MMTEFKTSVLKNDIKLLAELDPFKESLGILKDGHLKKTHRSAIRNLFRWLIHKITCSKTPLNPDLDKVTRQILSDSQAYSKAHSSSNNDKNLFVTAIQNLQIVCQRNGGSLSNQVAQMLRAAKKIEIFVAKESENDSEKQSSLKKHREEKPSSDTLNDSRKNEKQPQNENKNLKNETPAPVVSVPDNPKTAANENQIKAEPPVIPVKDKPKTDENPLQNFLVSCESERYYSTSKTDQLCALLEKIDHCDGLSDKHIAMLNALLRNIQFMNEYTGRPSWIEANAKKIKPDLLKFLIDNTSDEESGFISRLYPSLISEPVNSANLEAFVKGFKHSNQFKQSLILSFSKTNFELFKQHLSEELLRTFLRNVFINIGYLDVDKVLDIVNDFDETYQAIALESLCHSSKEYNFLAKIYKRHPKDSILKLILDLNPCKEDDKFDLWFINFMEEVGLENIYLYVLKNGTEARKIILLEKCAPEFLQMLLSTNPKDPQSDQDLFFELVLQAYPFRISDYIMSQECPERKNRYLLHCSGSTEILKYFEQVPSELLEQFSAENLIRITKEIAYKKHERQNEYLSKLCKAIETKISPSYETFEPYLTCVISPETTFGILFPYFSPEYQCRIIFADGKISSAADSLTRKIFPEKDLLVESEKAKIYAPIVENILKNRVLTKELLEKRDFILSKLLLHFSEELQIKILTFALTKSCSLYRLEDFFNQLPPKVWENTSREIKEKISGYNSIFQKGTAEQQASFINGRTKDNFNLDDFFHNLFNEGFIKKEIDNTILVETQKRALAYLNPTLFEKLKDDIKTEAWEKLLFALSTSPMDEHHQNIFLAAVEKMLKSEHIKTFYRAENIGPSIKKILDREELTWSLEKCSRPVRLLLTILSNNMRGSKYRNSIKNTANEMSKEEINNLNRFFISIHSSTEIDYFCKFFRLLDTLEFKPEFIEICVNFALHDAVYYLHSEKEFFYYQRQQIFRHLPTAAWPNILKNSYKIYDPKEMDIIATSLPVRLARTFVRQNLAEIYGEHLSSSKKSTAHSSSKDIFKLSDDAGFIAATLQSHPAIWMKDIADFFNLFPWRLLLTDKSQVTLKSRLQQELSFAAFEQLPKLPEESFGKMSEQLEDFLEAAEGENLNVALNKYQKIPDPIKELFFIPVKKAVQGPVVDLKYMNYGQFLAILITPDANKALIEAIKLGNIDLFDVNFIDFINYAIKLKNQLQNDKGAVGLIEKFLDSPCTGRLIMFEDQFTDIEFKLGYEHIKVHKVLLTLVPELKEYISSNSPTIVPENEIENVKSLINELYRNYKISDIPSKRFEMQSSAAISFSTLYDNHEAFPDFTIFIISKKEAEGKVSEKEIKKIAVHRTILNTIPYFQRLFSGNYIENKQITFDEEKLKESEVSVEAIVACIRLVYSSISVDQIDDKDTEEAITTALEFLGFKTN